jgi:hypothetical protein
MDHRLAGVAKAVRDSEEFTGIIKVYYSQVETGPDKIMGRGRERRDGL